MRLISPSIISIKNKVNVDSEFSFSPVTPEDIKKVIDSLNPKKNGGNIPTKQLKEVSDIACVPISVIWNTEIVINHIFHHKLKLHDITPIFKSLENSLKKNYRGISVIPIVSKILEKIMDKQINDYIEKYLSPYLCGYRKGYSCQYALLSMIEKWKMYRDKGGHAGGILMDLSKAFDTIKHELLIAKLHAYGFSYDALEIIQDYLKDRWQRTKINTSFSTWAEILCGTFRGTLLGPKFFNIFINDLFYLFINTNVCNIADDTTPYACDTDLPTLLQNLESDAASAMMWFDANCMKSNQSKCHFLLISTGPKEGPPGLPEQMWIKAGDQIIWESSKEKLLGMSIDKYIKFDHHLTDICKKASGKVTALSRLVRIVPLDKKIILMKSFIESQFSFCPLVWMFCLSRKLNNRINHIHKRGLRIVYQDYTSSFGELLAKDKSVCIHHRNIQRVALEMFKVKNDLCPEIMKEIFTFVANPKSTKTFIIPNVNSEYMGKLSLRWFGPVVWETMLPECYKNITELENFKEDIKKWVPDNCKCRLCKEYIASVGFIETFE